MVRTQVSNRCLTPARLRVEMPFNAVQMNGVQVSAHGSEKLVKRSILGVFVSQRSSARTP